MKKLMIGICAFVCTLFVSCNNTEEGGRKLPVLPKEGVWLAQINLNDSTVLPFHFDLKHTSDSTYALTIKNAEERIEVTDITIGGDSTRIQLPVFANYIQVITTPMEMRGLFHNPDAADYALPFTAQYNFKERFTFLESKCCNLNKKWHVEFSPGTEDKSDGIAYFEQQDSLITATVMTETGDYRYLEGILSGEHLKLSAFDGAHLFYFEGKVLSGQKMKGRFYSGRSFTEPFIAYRDDAFELRNADSLTFLKEGAGPFSFSFPTSKGTVVSLADQRFQGKPVIVQIMGSWCPNCMDETRFLNSMYEQYHAQGLEIVGISFERARDKAAALKRVEKMQRDLNIAYPVVIGGYTRDDKAGEALPMLNHVMSFPTAIYLNRAHEVVKIHTGFTGPGTPVYQQYTTDAEAFIQQILKQAEE
jgi:thiol-disulfide isomerase/thioredoxin